MTIMIPAWEDGTLKPVEKLDVHQRGLKHKAVSVFLMQGAKILLQQRALGKYHTPGLWTNTCCTHPHWDEPSDLCATRRLKEELGLEIFDLTLRHQLEYRADVGGGLIEHEIVDVFTGEVRKDVSVALNPDEVMNTRWMTINALMQEIRENPEHFTPWLRIYLTEHAEKIFVEGPR